MAINIMSINLLKHFSKVFCINLARRQDRRAQATQEFEKWGIADQVEWYSAVDGQQLTELPKGLLISNGALGLIMTLVQIVKYAKENNLPNVLVLEDDVYFRETITKLDAYMAEVPDNWGLLYLGGHHIQRPLKLTNKIARGVQIFTTHSFAINASIYDIILTDLSNFENVSIQLDLYFAELQNRVPTYCFIPSMTGQTASYSDIESRYTDYTDNMDENLNFDDSLTQRFLTVAIPCYEMHGHGHQFLSESLFKLTQQTYKDFNVVVSDHSSNDLIKQIVDYYRREHGLQILYVRKEYERDNASSNMNNAIRLANGKYIKLLFQDDFLYDEHALQNTVNAINANPGCQWLVSASEHSHDGINCVRPFYPRWNDNFLQGVNTISSPSVVTIKNTYDKLFFDLSLCWLMDCDYYHRYRELFGLPVIINEITVVNRLWGNQLTNTLSDEQKEKDFEFIRKKYADRLTATS